MTTETDREAAILARLDALEQRAGELSSTLDDLAGAVMADEGGKLDRLQAMTEAILWLALYVRQGRRLPENLHGEILALLDDRGARRGHDNRDRSG